jgi:putative ATPase
MGYSGGYKYPHNFSGNYVPEDYLPDELRGQRYYEPSSSGEEADIRERLQKWRDEAGNKRGQQAAERAASESAARKLKDDE